MKNRSFVVLLVVLVIAVINQNGYSNAVTKTDYSKAMHDNIVLPKGYSLEKYTVEKISNLSCRKDNECKTPVEYLIQSHCPFVSLCLENKCTVVCPQHESN